MIGPRNEIHFQPLKVSYCRVTIFFFLSSIHILEFFFCFSLCKMCNSIQSIFSWNFLVLLCRIIIILKWLEYMKFFMILMMMILLFILFTSFTSLHLADYDDDHFMVWSLTRKHGHHVFFREKIIDSPLWLFSTTNKDSM